MTSINFGISCQPVDGIQVLADSRIPQVDFGTPEQDALRRDFTINSLFYNIDTEVVEDLTGHGKEDLKAGLIRTPLPASETFQDGESWTVNEDVR